MQLINFHAAFSCALHFFVNFSVVHFTLSSTFRVTCSGLDIFQHRHRNAATRMHGALCVVQFVLCSFPVLSIQWLQLFLVIRIQWYSAFLFLAYSGAVFLVIRIQWYSVFLGFLNQTRFFGPFGKPVVSPKLLHFFVRELTPHLLWVSCRFLYVCFVGLYRFLVGVL